MNRSSYASRLKVCAILKLVELDSYFYDTGKLKISKKQKWLPLSPDEFNVYAYPELRYQNIDAAENLDYKPKIDSTYNSAIEQQKLDFNNNDNLIHDEKYIENLHHEIDKRARIEFSKQMQKQEDNTLRDILDSLKDGNQEIIESISVDNKTNDTSLIVQQNVKPVEEKLVIKESLKPIANMKTNMAKAELPTINSNESISFKNELETVQNQTSTSNTLQVQNLKSEVNKTLTINNNQSEVKFTISIDKNEQNKYYTDVLDCVDKLFDNKDGRQFKTMTEIVDEIIEAEIKDNKKN